MSRNAAPDPAPPIAPSSPSAALAAVLAAAREGRLGRQLVHAAYLPASPARFGELDPPLPPELTRGLAQTGVTRLFSHQADGIAAVRRGESVLLTTPTASGKSLVFQVPPLEEALRGGPGRALYLFPLKALGQDQRGKFRRLAEAAGLSPETAGCEIYDGDTPRPEREAIRRNFPRVVISNPDMLHLGVLGAWTGWGPFLADLRWIVLDELHTYRGIFGSHFHHVLARFLRLCRAVGADPAVIASSATAGNAAEFAAALTGKRLVEITEIAASGAPREGRHLLLFRPDGSPYTTALQLLTACLQAGLKTIVFTKARRITELLYSWLQRGEPELARRVASYRAGFLPEERRGIERELSTGRLEGVISTSALELGIDIGGLDACILVGYPGSMMATWQRSGRVGRAGRESLTAMVALPDALDQYLLDHPDEFLGRPCERLVVDPGNVPVARAHLVCAAAELPLSKDGDGPYLERHAAPVGDLLREAKLLEAADGDELVSPRRRPQRDINLRGSGRTYAIEDAGRGRMMGTVDGVRVFHECHPGAVYLHAGRQYLVEELKIDERRVRAAAADVDYFTTPLTEKETEILAVLKERRDGPLRARLCELKVTERVVGFQRKRIQGQEVIDQQELDLPPSEWETVGVVWEAPRAVQETLARAGEHFMGALHASEHAAISLVPLLALCDRGDLGGISMPFHPQVGCGCVFLYDGHPGGVGIAARTFEDLPELLSRVLALLDACPCDDGCPSCVQSPKCGNGNRPLDKAGAARVLRLLLGREEAAIEWSDAEPLEPIPRMDEGGPDHPSPAQAVKSSGREKRKLEDDESADRSRSHRLSPAQILRSAQDDKERLGVAPLPDRHPERSEGSGRGNVPSRDPAISGRSRRPPSGGWRGVEGSHISRGAGRDRQVSPRRSPASTDMGYHAVTGPAAGSISAPPPPHRPSALARTLRIPGLASILDWLRARLPRHRPVATGGTVLFDLETLRSAAEVGGWGNSHLMGISLGVAYHLEEDRFHVFPESRIQDLHDLLRAASLVVGFNIRRFDYAVLRGYTGEDYARTLPTLDLLDEVCARLGFRLGLDHLARETLGTSKSGDGLQCLEWVREGRLDLVESYCRKDVEILRDLFLHGRREGCLYYRDKAGDRRLKLPVEW
jgi:DEAD/DEAH box helicase domain-containing protein